MTSVRVSLLDAYLLRHGPAGPLVLALRRAAGGRCPGSWEAVHGHIEPGETPAEAAGREIREETGLLPARLYSLSRVESFYQHRLDEVALVPVFAGWVEGRAEVTLSLEHDAFDWVPAELAAERFSWPREARAVEDALRLLADGTAGPLEDVLRVW